MNSHLCLVFTAPAKLRVELRAKIGNYRNRCYHDLEAKTDLRASFSFQQRMEGHFSMLRFDLLCNYVLNLS